MDIHWEQRGFSHKIYDAKRATDRAFVIAKNIPNTEWNQYKIGTQRELDKLYREEKEKLTVLHNESYELGKEYEKLCFDKSEGFDCDFLQFYR